MFNDHNVSPSKIEKTPRRTSGLLGAAYVVR